MTLTANRNVDVYVDQTMRDYPVGAAVHIYRDAFVGVDPAGYLKAFEPGDLFVGIAYEECDNSSGSAGDLFCTVRVRADFDHALSSVALKDIGKAVYATADNALALTGHPDAYAGRILHYENTNLCVIRLKEPGEKPTVNDDGHLEVVYNPAEPLTVTGAAGAGAIVHTNGLRVTSALGLGVLNQDANDGGGQLEFDAVAEIAQASIETPVAFKVSGGITLDVELHLTDIGDNAALDVDWGMAAVLNATTRADLDDASTTSIAGFHMDGSADAILAQSDNGTTDVAPVDTGVVNVVTAGAYKKFKVIVRPAGTVEFWVDGVRKLPSTAFAVLATHVLGGFINMEKTSDNTTAVLKFRRFRMAGART
jgi:hypothetical protein